MSNWYQPYLDVYDKPFDPVKQAEIIKGIRQRIAAMQSEQPVTTISVIGYNEERHLLACLWSLSNTVCRYPIEIIGVDNDSTDRTAEIFSACARPYYKETRHSCGWARQCGLSHARGRYHLNIDADTMYPPAYAELMTDMLEQQGTVGVSSLWSYIPDEQHSRLALWCYELLRDTHLWMQHFTRPELAVRGLVFGYRTDEARRFGIRTDIIRGEDGYLAFQLRTTGRIRFLRDRRARAVTGYGTVSESLAQALWHRVRKYASTCRNYFTSTLRYDDNDDNIVGKSHSKQ